MKNDLGVDSKKKEKKIITYERKTNTHAITRCDRGMKRKGTLIIRLKYKKQVLLSSSQLPLDDLLPAILKWLPLESLCRFKCVSKCWCSLIIHHFHGLPRRPIVAMVDDNGMRLCRPQLLSSFGFCLVHPQTGVANVSWNPAVKYFHFNYTTCNGLFCLLINSRRDTLAIYNPVTREKPLLLPKKKKQYCFSFYSLGFDPLSKRYKVLVVTDYPDCFIYTVGTKSWRRISCKPPIYKRGSRLSLSSVCINGVLYWYCGVTNTVIVFNLASECFSKIDGLPSEMKNNVSYLFEFEGCLCLTYEHANNYDLWMFKDNAKWVMVASIVRPSENIIYSEPYLTRTGEIVLCEETKDSRILYAYSILTRQFDTIKVSGVDSKASFLVINYVESSQSLKDL